MTSASAVKFCFCAEKLETEVSIGDGAVLIFDENGIAGSEQFAK